MRFDWSKLIDVAEHLAGDGRNACDDEDSFRKEPPSAMAFRSIAASKKILEEIESIKNKPDSQV